MHMVTYIIASIFLVLAGLCVVLRKAYAITPVHELKRQAAHGNELARTFYTAVAYGDSLRALLWLVILVGSATCFVLIAANAAVWIAIILTVLGIWFMYIWLPKTRVSSLTIVVARRSTPVVVWILHYLDGPLRFVSKYLARHSRPHHSGLYELQDLLNLLDLQSQQPDSRIATEQIELIRTVSTFGDRKVRDTMRPRKAVRSVSVGDAIGPVLLDELHASGQTVFPVKKSNRSKEIVASLHLGDVGIHSTGTVQDYATQGTAYINESDSLADALHAFFQTKQQLFVVIDSEQEYVGAITLEDILHTLVGRPAPNETLGSHDQPEVVAARHDEQTVVE